MRKTAIICLGLVWILLPCRQGITQSNGTEKAITGILSAREDIQQANAILQDELLEFVPDHYSILDSVSGDLNMDGLEDCILVLKRNGEDTLKSNSAQVEKRSLLILIRQANKRLQLARKNNNAVYCFDCGGMMGDPYVGITIKDGYFTIEHYGGSAWRWTRLVTYEYSKPENEWFLSRDSLENFHATEPEKKEYHVKTKEDFGKIKFEDYNIYQEE